MSWSLDNFLLIRKEKNEDKKREWRRSRSAHKYRKSMNRFRARVSKRNVWGVVTVRAVPRIFISFNPGTHPLFDSFPPVACNVQLPLIELLSLEAPTLSISTVCDGRPSHIEIASQRQRDARTDREEKSEGRELRS